MSDRTDHSSPAIGPWWLPLWQDELDHVTPDLTRAAMLLAAHGSAFLRAPNNLESELRRLDHLVDAAAARTNIVAVDECGVVDATARHWITACRDGLRLAGDTRTYHDPRNSFLPDIGRRRQGLPIGLAVVWLHAAKRMGVDAFGVGMPGHFLVGFWDRGNETKPETTPATIRYVDCFHHGAVLSEADCDVLYRRLFEGRPHPPFRSELLAPTPPDAILIRMIANLKQHAARRRDLATLADLARLRWYLPMLTVEEARELIRLCTAIGYAGEASSWFTAAVDRFGDLYAENLRAVDHRIVQAALS
jgi:regulator of sirC expression with transglutaminase-like and TPR domain